MIWYVATLSRYELVEAGTADEARRVGEARMPGRTVRTVRPATGDEIAINELPEFLRRERHGYEATPFELPPQGISLEGVEKELILKALRKLDWNQTKAAAFLDISRRTLIYRMEKYGFHREGLEVVKES